MSLDTTTAPEEQAAAEAETTSANGTEAAETAPEPEQPKRGRQKGPTARKTRTIELTLTVTGTADGDWQADLKKGSTWVARGLIVSAAAVSRAAKELHTDLSTPIDEVIDAAREQQKAKGAQLEAELEEAKQALAELNS